MPTSDVVLETRALTRRFGDLVAVDGVNLQVEVAQIFGLLGSNGAGKTTMIKMLTTLLPPSGGTATVAGYDIQRQPARVRRVIGYVPQMLSADGNLTGYDLLIFAKIYDVPRRERASRIGDALAPMGLEDAGARLVREHLSRCLAHSPYRSPRRLTTSIRFRPSSGSSTRRTSSPNSRCASSNTIRPS